MDPLITKRGAKPYDIKINNRQIILDLLKRTGDMSLNEMAQACSLSRNTVKKCVDHFLEQGLVEIKGKGVSTSEGGKRPDIYGINRSWGVIASVYYNDNELICELYDPCTQLIEKMTRSCVSWDRITPDVLVEEIALAVENALKLHGKSWSDLRGVAFGCRRIIYVEHGRIISSFNDQWPDIYPLDEELEKRFGDRVEILVRNAVRLLAVSERRKKEALRENGVLICAENPYTSAVVVRQGGIITGDRRIVGVLSALPMVQEEDQPLICGKGKNNLSNLVSIQSLSRYILRHHSSDISLLVSAAKKGTLTLKGIFGGVQKQDPVALSAIRFAIKWFTIAIHYFVYTIDPNLVMISGEYSHAPELFFRELTESVKGFGMRTVQFSPEIVPGTMRLEDGAVQGGASLVLERLFHREDLYH